MTSMTSGTALATGSPDVDGFRVVLIGAGGFGECWWDALAERDDIELVAAVDPDRDALVRAAAAFALPAEQLLADDSSRWEDFPADIVLDCSPFPLHADHGLRAVRSGKHYLAAKPLALNESQVDALIEASQDCDVQVVALQQMRYFECFREVRRLVEAGDLGSVEVAEVRMALDGRGWEPGTQWRLALDNPLLFEAGVHHFDLLRYVLGQEFRPAAVRTWRQAGSAFTGHDTCVAQLDGDGGTSVLYRASFAPFPDPVTRFDSGWDLHCTDGIIMVRDGAVLVRRTDGEVRVAVAGRPDPEPLEVLNRRLLDDILAALRQDVLPPCDGADNARTMRLLFDVVAAAEQAS
jgi:predicted dehydrogenase